MYMLPRGLSIRAFAQMACLMPIGDHIEVEGQWANVAKCAECRAQCKADFCLPADLDEWLLADSV